MRQPLAMVIYGLAVIGVAAVARWQAPAPDVPPASARIAAVWQVLDQLRDECARHSPGSDYSFYPVPPTEARRIALIESLCKIGPSALIHIRLFQQQTYMPEYREMLVLAAAALGDEESLAPTGRLMAWSRSPAVRISAARVLRKLHNPRSIEWLHAALDDDRFVLNCGCGTPIERYYPVRTVAEIALIEMGQAPSIPP